jgi:hypothetical protein
LIDKTKANQESMLKEVQAELKSLKALMINRKIGVSMNGTDTDSSSTQPFIPSFPGVNFNIKPALPAWQLAAAQKVKNENVETFTKDLDGDVESLDGVKEKLKVEVVESDSDASTDTAIHLPQ